MILNYCSYEYNLEKMAEGISYSRKQRRDEEKAPSEEGIYKQFNELSVNDENKKMAKCESCVRGSPWFERVAEFLCFLCEMYVCGECLPKHEWHEGMRVRRNESERHNEREISEKIREQSERVENNAKGLGKKTKRMRLDIELEKNKEREESERNRSREQKEREIMRRKYITKIFNENEIERTRKFYNSQSIICDRVEVKHELDLDDCCIYGLCGLQNNSWVVCDYNNDCIKLFKMGSNRLQRYIKFMSAPRDVTEIYFRQNSTEPNLEFGSSSNISVTDRTDQHKQCLIAVTLPRQRQIIFIDLSKKQARTHKIIRTEKRCYSIQHYDDRILTVCRERSSRFSSIYIMSTSGETLSEFGTGCYDPHLAVVSGKVYLTDCDYDENKVQCRNIAGQVMSEITIEGSKPVGISVDRENNVYVCAWADNKVYKLGANLSRYKSVLDQTTDYIERPEALCYNRDKLFISHGSSPLDNVVTVVRLL